MRVLVLALLVGACTSAPPERYAVKKHPPLVAEDPPPADAGVRLECDPSALERTELRLPSAPDVEVFVVQILAPGERRGALVFTHGAGSASSALWDLSPVDYSMMRKLACTGWDTYAVDVRGFGGSTIPAALKAPAERNPPAVRARDVQPDVDAAIQHARRTSKVDRVSLFAWSWGCVVAGLYASEHPDTIDRLLLLAPVYDRRWPKRHITDRAWRTEKKQLFFDYHDPAREDRAVLDAHVAALFRFADGDTLVLPNGPYRDLYGDDAPVYDAKKIRAHTLIVRGEEDRASLEPNAYRLFEALENAASKRYVVLGGAGHFVFRTLGYRALHETALAFFNPPR